jgi:crotonobetainyl-CoA:carnitine CoA-transferase CaiB-like acyl-CoA transferase
MIGPLSDLFALEFSAIFAGPYGAQFLATMGAEVVRVEPPGGARGRQGGWSHAVSHSRKSIVIDLQKPAGREIALGLAKQADVLIENFRPGAMARLGLGYEALSSVNPRLVYCSLSGYGDRGPLRDAPGQDLLVEAVSGLMSIIGYDDRVSIPAGTFPADAVGGMLSALGIMFALHERERSGLGQHVKTSLLMALLALQPWEITDFLTNARLPRRVGSGHYLLGPVYGAYRTRDGEIVVQGDILRVARALDCDALAAVPGLDLEGPRRLEVLEAHRDEIRGHLQASLEKLTRKEALERLAHEEIWSMPVLTYPEALSQPQMMENEMLASYEDPTAGTVRTVNVPVKLGRTPGAIQGPPPELGEHTEEVLRQRLGLSGDDISRLRADGIIG